MRNNNNRGVWPNNLGLGEYFHVWRAFNRAQQLQLRLSLSLLSTSPGAWHGLVFYGSICFSYSQRRGQEKGKHVSGIE